MSMTLTADGEYHESSSLFYVEASHSSGQREPMGNHRRPWWYNGNRTANSRNRKAGK